MTCKILRNFQFVKKHKGTQMYSFKAIYKLDQYHACMKEWWVHTWMKGSYDKLYDQRALASSEEDLIIPYNNITFFSHLIHSSHKKLSEEFLFTNRCPTY
jgi:hypothetical protein